MTKKLRPFVLAVVAVIATVSMALPVQSYVAPSAPPSGQTAFGFPVQIAQEPNTQQNSTLYFTTPNYVVSVYPRTGTPLRMNIYNRSTGQLEQNAAPVTYRGQLASTPWVSYDSFGSRNAQNVIFRANANRTTNQASLEIIVQATNALQVQENSTSIAAINVPDITTGGGQQPNLDANTILAFETRTFSARVYTRDNTRLLNVYDKLSQQSAVNGQVATLLSPTEAPYQNWVSYYGGASFRNIPGRYFVRANSGGEAVLQFIDATGRVVLEEQRIGPLVVNIPQTDLPPGVTPPAATADLSPFVAAVFGNEQTLTQVRAIAPQAQFESARQGRFINAGSFTNRFEAESLVNILRARGFDSRLVYRDVNYR
ncbi:hypothetical protein [Pseudanabaena sp. FACHB-2040]|uniref:hypothetical protein n=1 Tax=Pseudanabaena sp. FACHB-2040 TaxID=2692859 RepID=UPI001682CE5B|nr:hypothetical protein [Pseudanabaena sp. FACHB-2040]MBD2257323.1 hypothetical protein [Pseudanabaena sp. FACHB-2040]